MNSPPHVTIYHNPACGTSRNTLALIRNAGVEPEIIEYLKTPPDRATLRSETVLDILPLSQKGPFMNEGGERVLDERGQRLR